MRPLNKKANVLGKTITAIPAFITIIVVIIGYLGLAFAMRTFKQPEVPLAETSAEPDSILFQTIGSTSTKKQLILDVLIELELEMQRKIERDVQLQRTADRDQAQALIARINDRQNYGTKLKEKIRQAVEDKNQGYQGKLCFIVFEGGQIADNNIQLQPVGKDFFIQVENNKAVFQTNRETELKIANNAEKMTNLMPLQIRDKETNKLMQIQLKYYYGECP